MVGRQHGGPRRRLSRQPLMNIVEVCHLDVASFGAVGRPEGRGLHRAARRPLGVPQAALPRRAAHRRGHLRARRGHLDHQRRGHAQGPRLLGRRSLGLEGAPEARTRSTSSPRSSRSTRPARLAARDHPGPAVAITPASPDGVPYEPDRDRDPRRRRSPRRRRPTRYAGKLLRVNLSTGKCWTEPWSEEDMREYLGGIGLGAKILYDEVGPKVAVGSSRQPPHPGHRARSRACRCGARAGSPSSRAARSPTAPRPRRPTASSAPTSSTRATTRSSSRDRPRSSRTSTSTTTWSRCATRRIWPGKDTWETQQALETEHGLAGHRLSVYAIGPAGENLRALRGHPRRLRPRRLQERLRRGDGQEEAQGGVHRARHQGARRRTTRAGSSRPPTTSRTTSRPTRRPPRSTTWGTLPGVANLSSSGALPIKNYTTNLTDDVDMNDVGGPRSSARASTTAGTSATPAACATATSR